MILFPGRHHLLTRFQAEHLTKLGETVVWAVTSANHANTRRNPVPYHRREAAIERFSVRTGLRSVVVPIFDTAPTTRFASITLKNITVATGLVLTPDNTVVACSTPAVAELYASLGFSIDLVEAAYDPSPARPWDVLLRLAAGDSSWRELAHPATIDVYERYRLDETVRTVVNDPVVGDEGGLTTTRDYRTYAEAFADAAERKWKLVKEHVRPGRIVDIGCGAGAILEMADREPALRESDLIGVEVARHLYDECVHKKSQGVFENENVYFYRRNVLGGAVFPPRSIDTTLTFALTHEIWSYGSQEASIRAFVQAIYDHTAPGGVWINSDVCGPDNKDRPVALRLDAATRPVFDRFAADYKFTFDFSTDGPGTVVLRLADAMDFLTRKDYTDNWESETREQFCGLEFADWKQLLTDAGFEIDPVSHAYRNDWIIDNRIAPVAALATPSGEPLEWPVTHVLLVARRPLNT
ncbi:class I SAM-dependent methyltransferase [Actinoplanes sp. NPDC049265]|uniref:class I SAM-dependent methyltransferase n=1 Tax=Actinoplanes sp. NPDC049265 TaxID=3363902 RepID=UPI00371466C9